MAAGVAPLRNYTQSACNIQHGPARRFGAYNGVEKIVRDLLQPR
jgi:hypothetical protein